MSKKLYEENNIRSIGDAIRAKNGTSSTYTTAQMAEAIRAIHGDEPILQEKTATQNGIILPDTGYDGLSKVTVNVSGGDTTGIVSPSYRGLSYCYVTNDGTAFYHDTSLIQYLNIFEVQARHTYILAVGSNPGARRRAAFFPGRTYSQFEPHLNEPANQEAIFSDGIWLAPYVQGTDDRGDALMGRISYTPLTNGVIVYGTDNTGATCPAHCIDVCSNSGRTVIRIVTHSTDGNNASIDIYVNETLITNVLYNTVQGDKAHSFDDVYNIFVGYNINAAKAPDNLAHTGWCIYSPSDVPTMVDGVNIGSNSLIQNWAFNALVDLRFYI